MNIPSRLQVYDNGREEFYLKSADALPKGQPRGTLGEVNYKELADEIVARYNRTDPGSKELMAVLEDMCTRLCHIGYIQMARELEVASSRFSRS